MARPTPPRGARDPHSRTQVLAPAPTPNKFRLGARSAAAASRPLKGPRGYRTASGWPNPGRHVWGGLLDRCENTPAQQSAAQLLDQRDPSVQLHMQRALTHAFRAKPLNQAA